MNHLEWFPPRQRELREEGLLRPALDWLLHLTTIPAREIWRDAVGVVDRIERFAGLERDVLILQVQERRLDFRLSGGKRKPDRAIDSDRLDALAMVCDLAARILGMRPYPVQVYAALGMYAGYAVEMLPGEGKTLSACLAAVLHGWSGRPCHVITANDYLAARDAAELSLLYAACGLTVSSIDPESDDHSRREAYRADVVYATGKQLLADYLRDHLALRGATTPVRMRLQGLRSDGARVPVMRGLYAAIVDEADSVLIDDAVTPLIISSPDQNERLFTAVLQAQELVNELVAGRDYHASVEHRHIRFTPAGERHLEILCADLPPMWRAQERREDLMRKAVMAKEFFELDRHYMLQEGKIILLDENTGRAMPGRSWSYGLHQAVEAKEGLELTAPTRTMVRMSFQRFFGLYHKLSGASGTLRGVRLELWWTYRLKTLTIPPRLPSQLRVRPRKHFRTVEERLQDLVATAIQLHEAGLPVLIGTRRIEDSEAAATLLAERHYPCSVLNAKEHENEAAVVAEAGYPGRITVATNMAGRGTDIRIQHDVAQRGGLQVLMFEPHESRRVDWQLFGRAGRQGAPGMAQPFASVDDELLRRRTPLLARPLYWILRWPFAHWTPARGALLGLLVPLAQGRAQRLAWRQRRSLVKLERIQNEQLTFAGREDRTAPQENRPATGPG